MEFNVVFMAGSHSDIRFRSFIPVYRDNSLIVYSEAEAGNELWRGTPVDFMAVWKEGIILVSFFRFFYFHSSLFAFIPFYLFYFHLFSFFY